MPRVVAFALATVSALAAACGGASSGDRTSGSADPGTPASVSEAVGTEEASDAGTSEAGRSIVQTAPAQTLIVQTDKGALRGTSQVGASAYLGIPYASPPVGALRWQPPADLPAWSGVREATSFGETCIQLATDGTLAPGGSEDCLTLNVWTPTNVPAGTVKPLPVMAFIHGGFFVKGGATASWHGETVYDGADLAARANVVVVTLQYRLGAFGFLAHPALSTPSAPHGNYALLDQMAALSWVQKNIASFGGDKNRVTIWGQSAGGTSVAALLASPMAGGLFSRAIIESGGFTAYSIATATSDANEVAQTLSCSAAADIATCLRSAPAASVATALPNSALGPLRWHFIEDGLMLPDDPVNLFQAGSTTRVPVLLGTNRDELSAMIYDYLAADGLAKPTDQKSYEADVTALYGKEAPAVLTLYPYVSFASSPVTGLSEMVADDQYICPTRQAARALSAQTFPNGDPVPVWRYVFAHSLPRSDFSGGAGYSSYGAYHFLEMPFLFHAMSPTDFTFNQDERGLSLSMIAMWTSFAASGNPNNPNAGASWPAYNPDSDAYLSIDTTSTPSAGVRTQQCDFWDTH